MRPGEHVVHRVSVDPSLLEQHPVAITEAEAASANAAVERARAALRRAELDLEYTRILALSTA